MQEKFLNNELYIFLTKIIFPAFLAVGVKIAIEMKKNKTKITFFNVFASMMIGVSGAYLSSDLVVKNCSPEHVPIVIALIAITSEKIGDFIIYKFNVEYFLIAVIDGFFDTILKMKKK